MAPVLAEVIAVYEQGKPRIVSLDILKEFRGENNIHGLTSDPKHPSFQGGDEITEIPSSELERPITERIKSQERQLDRREMLLFMFLSFTSTEGFNDWSELTDVYT